MVICENTIFRGFLLSNTKIEKYFPYKDFFKPVLSIRTNMRFR